MRIAIRKIEFEVLKQINKEKKTEFGVNEIVGYAPQQVMVSLVCSDIHAQKKLLDFLDSFNNQEFNLSQQGQGVDEEDPFILEKKGDEE